MGVRHVNELAFDGSAEADLVDALRAAGAHTVSLVAVRRKEVVGHILFSPVKIESHNACLSAQGLAPMAVLPEHQRMGIGSRLVNAGLKECVARGIPAVVVLGHPKYYPRFGFVPAKDFSIKSEYDVPSENFMVIELGEGALTGHAGVAKYRDEFSLV